MPCPPYRWTEDRRKEVEAALRASQSRAEAATRLSVSLDSLTHACARYRLRPRHLLMGSAAMPPPMEIPVPVEEGSAPWQGYKPRPGWTEPEKAKPAKTRAEKVIRSIVIADAHVPYAKSTAWSCALGIIRDMKPDRVIVNGDFLDLESLSRHPKSRPDLSKLASELYAGNLALDALQEAAQGAETFYLEGNHEARAPRFACEYGELDGMLSVPVGLYLQQRAEYHRSTAQLRGMHWIPLAQQPFRIGALGVLHGVFEGIMHARQHAEALGPKTGNRVIVTAHMHAWQSFTSSAGFTCYACPWLGDESQHVFRAYTKGKPRPWSNGLLRIEEAGDSVTVTPIFIENGRALAAGRIVQAAA